MSYVPGLDRLQIGFRYLRLSEYSTHAKIAETTSPIAIDHPKNCLCFRRSARPPMPGSR